MAVITAYNFSQETLQAISLAGKIARQSRHAHIGAPHLLKALLHKDLPMLKQLESKGADVFYLEEWAETYLEQYPKSPGLFDDPEPDEKCNATFRVAGDHQLKLQYTHIEPECLLMALSTPGVAFSFEQLKSYPLSSAELLNWYQSRQSFSIQHSDSSPEKRTGISGKTSSLLNKYCINRQHSPQPENLFVGRSNEIRQIQEIICRKTKNNVLLTGEPGVGKSALLNGFSGALSGGRLPGSLHQLSLFELDKAALMATAIYKGEKEDKLCKIFSELSHLDHPLLIIDDVHLLFDPAGNEICTLLKSELSKGNITFLLSTNPEAYRKNIEKDPAFSRLLETIILKEPDLLLSEKILRAQAASLEQHHRLSIHESVFSEAVRLAGRYVSNRKLPDSALDLLDRTLAVCQLATNAGREEIEKIKSQIESLPESTTLSEWQWHFRQMNNSLSPVLLARAQAVTDWHRQQDSSLLKTELLRQLDALATAASADKKIVDCTDLQAVVAHLTGIPLGKIGANEQQRLLTMEKHLQQRVVGQDGALKTVCDAIRESRAGLSRQGQPVASFFFLGPTGTGKTELAKALAEFLFGSEAPIIRFDMSEFKEEHSAALLYGAPPGYVGYEEGGLLVNRIRHQPYSIVLFDEIEKAHPSVFDTFLHIMDEGRLHDRLGKEGDFSHAVIIFTSNIGSDAISEKFRAGQLPDAETLTEHMGRYFRPEFLGRLTEIIPFAPISQQDVLRIFYLHLQPLQRQLAEMGIQLEISRTAAAALAREGFSDRYGVRPVKAIIRSALRKPLSRMIIAGELQKAQKVRIDREDTGEIRFQVAPID